MKPQVLIVKGSLKKLQEIYKALQGNISVRSRTIYPFAGKHRLMVGCFLSVDEMAAILNDDSVKIVKHTV